MGDKIKPDFVTNKHLEYLDSLRSRGTTNMYGAGEYVQREFGMDRYDAKATLGYWMDTFSDRHPE